MTSVLNMTQNFLDNTLYEMGNLVVLRGMNDVTVHHIANKPIDFKRHFHGQNNTNKYKSEKHTSVQIIRLMNILKIGIYTQ